MQHEAALHFENNVGESLSVGSNFIGGCLRERRFRVQSF
jgi:hypothetical protein